MEKLIVTLIVGWLALCAGTVAGYELAAVDMAAQSRGTMDGE